MKRFIRIRAGLGIAALAAGLALPALAADSKEEKIKLEDCPAAVQKTINENAAGGTVQEVEKESKKDGSVSYEAEIKQADGTELEIVVAEDGKLIEVEED